MAPRLLSCFGRGASGAPHSNDGGNAAATADLSLEEQRRCGPVLVELFSSQGCAASPGAEAIAARIGRGDVAALREVPAAVLVFHVEYWDHVGWKDPFGSSMWTVRQKAYVESLRLDTLYTPQVVVNGRAEVMGNEEEKILAAVMAAPRFPSPAIQATFSMPSPSTLQVSFSGALRNKVDGSGADVMVALYESSLVTNCTKGENKDKVLSNDYVVRRLEKLASLKDFGPKKTLTATLTFELWEGFDAAKCGLLLFVQNGAYHTFGTQQFQIPDTV